MDYYFLFYRGVGFVSKAIRWQTRSIYSHVAIYCRGSIYEAWHTGGDHFWSGSVRRIRHPLEGHDRRTPVDIYVLRNTLGFDIDKAEKYLKSQLGKGYDFKNVWRFLPRSAAADNSKLFCSEYGLESAAAGGKVLLHINPAEAAPAHLSISPEIMYHETINGSPHPRILAAHGRL